MEKKLKLIGPFWLLVFLVLWNTSAWAQIDSNQAVPVDPQVRIGTLSNGLTYYVRENQKPEEKMELRLVVKAGSILEDDDQQGLAHFMEHMGFNGSVNFSENELVSFLQSIGVQFGADLNAYTSFDETVYILPIPLNNPDNLGTGMQVLADWAFGALLLDKDIDDERGVVIEEWRTGQGAAQRMRDRYFDKLLYNSRYAERLPIGKVDILENFEYETLRRFYREWYRPNLMAVIATGPVPQDEMIALIEEKFGAQQNPEGARERVYYDVPGHAETLVAIETDPEAPFIQIQFLVKHEKAPMATIGDMRKNLIRSAFTDMLDDRIEELTELPDPPFLGAGVGYSTFIGQADAYSLSLATGPDKIIEGFKAVLRENERVNRFGFTESEWERFKRSYLSSIERQYNDRDKVESGTYVSRYVSHFLNGSPIPDMEFRFAFAQAVLPTITVEEINAVGRELFTEENRVIILTGPQKDEIVYPTETQLLAAIAEIEAEDLEPYQEEVQAESLIPNLPTPGRIVAEEVNETLGTTTFTLSNGVKVMIKTTEFKNDEILMSATSKGGTSLIQDDADVFNGNFASAIVGGGGVGEFSSIDLQKVLSGVNARVFPSIGSYSQGISGNATPKDFETMLQLTHLYFTSPYRNENIFESFRSQQKTQMATMMASPDFQFQIQVNDFLTQGHPRGRSLPTVEELDALSLDRMMEIYKDRFADASGFTFTFVGNIDAQEAKPLLEQYLGSLPSMNRNENYRDMGVRTPSGQVEKVIRAGKDDKAQVIMLFSDETEYDLQQAQVISQLGEILTIKLIETLREEIGGVYGVGASGILSNRPVPTYQVTIQWPCGPDNVEILTEAAWKEINKIKENGPSAEDLAKVQETKRRQLVENRQRNNFWLGQLGQIVNGEYGDYIITEAEDRINKVTVADIQAAAKKYMDESQYIRVVRLPEE